MQQRNVYIPSHNVNFEQDQQPERPGGRAKRILKRILIALLVLAVLILVYIGYTLSQLSADPLDFRGLEADASGRTNILILGVGDDGHAGGMLSDTVMVMSLKAAEKKATFVSLPRDLRVPIPGEGSAKINQANALGGPKLAAKTVEGVLDITLHYYVVTNFSGLRKMVDAVGGIDIEVIDRLRDAEYPCDNDESKSCGIDIKPGHYRMDGTMALQYSRCRKGTCGNDFGRAERQQEVLAKLQNKMVDSISIFNPRALVLTTNVIREHVRTDLSAYQMLRLGNIWRQIPDSNVTRIVFSTAPGGLLRNVPGTSDLAPIGGSFVPLQKRLQE